VATFHKARRREQVELFVAADPTMQALEGILLAIDRPMQPGTEVKRLQEVRALTVDALKYLLSDSP
jgi:hypothetical protein